MTSPHSTRLSATLIAACLVVAGCSGDDTPTSASSTGSGASGTADDEPSTRNVTTGYGDVEVPANPQSIIVLNSQMTGMLESLGVNYSHSVNPWPDPSQFKRCTPWLVEPIGDRLTGGVQEGPEFKVEAVAALKPDLIVGNRMQQDVYEQLSAIAPVVTPNSKAPNPDWDVSLRTLAEATGSEDKVDGIIADVKKRYAAVADEYPKISGKSYQLVGMRPGTYVMGNGKPLELLGLKPGTNQTLEHQNKTQFSFEKLGDLDADLLVTIDAPGQSPADLESNPIFSELPSVKSGNHHKVDLATACAVNGSEPLALDWLLTERVTEWAKSLHESTP